MGLLIRKVRTLLKLVIGLLIRPLLLMIPSNDKIWVFGAWFGRSYSDNPKYMYEYCKKQQGINAYWVVKCKKLEKELRSCGINVIYYHSLNGIWIQARASVAFVGHSISSDLAPTFISPKCFRVQLWHGFPFKKIGFDDEKFNSFNRYSRKKNLLAYITNDRYSVAVSSGRLCSRRFESAFGLKKEQVHDLGFPRNDIVYISKPRNKKIIYMPTFRGTLYSYFNGITNAEIEELNAILEKKDLNLVIRPHPANVISNEMITVIDNSDRISLDKSQDIYSTIFAYDILITDFSSIMFDYSLTGKPIIFDLRGVDSYLEHDRSVYEDDKFHKALPGFNTWEQFHDIITNIDEDKISFDGLEQLQRCVEANLQVGACERIFQMIIESKKEC